MEPPAKRAKTAFKTSQSPREVALEVLPTSKSWASTERHFLYRLSNIRGGNGESQTEVVMDALVQANGICVLTFPREKVEAILGGSNISPPSVAFDPSLMRSTLEISGKRKKGAAKIKVGSRVCSVTVGSVEVALLSPVPGQLLELNTALASGGALLVTQPQGTGYIGVVKPDSEIPSLDNGGVIRPKECWSFAQTGACSRGDACKFRHNNA